jgi:hypothetical protein
MLKKITTAQMVLASLLAIPAIAQVPTPVPAPANPVVAPATPSPDALQHLLDARQYREAVKEASRLLGLHGPDAAGLNRFQIMLTKGYALVGAKQLPTAIATFKLAAKEATDPREIALAAWTSELFQRSRGTFFTPRGGAAKTAPIDLMSTEGRTQAFGVMLDSDLALLAPKIKTASASLNLTEIWPVVLQVKGLAQLDAIASGNEDRVNAVASELVNHSRNLLTAALKGMWIRTSDIDAHANVVNTNSTIGQDAFGNTSATTTTSKNGLTDANRRDLSAIIATCVQIHDAALAFAPLADDDKDWLAILTDSDRVGGRASDVLNTVYNNDSGNFANNTGTGLNDTGPYYGGTNLLDVNQQQEINHLQREVNHLERNKRPGHDQPTGQPQPVTPTPVKPVTPTPVVPTPVQPPRPPVRPGNGQSS